MGSEMCIRDRGFTVKGGMVTCGTENFRENLLVPVEGVPVIHKAIFMAVLTAHDDGARGPANGVGAEGVLKEHAVVGELVDFGSWVYRFEPAIVSAYGVRSMVVGEEKDDIGPLFLSDDG